MCAKELVEILFVAVTAPAPPSAAIANLSFVTVFSLPPAVDNFHCSASVLLVVA